MHLVGEAGLFDDSLGLRYPLTNGGLCGAHGDDAKVSDTEHDDTTLENTRE